MKDLVARLTSRKFLIAVASVIGVLAAANTGQVDNGDALVAIIAVVLGYLGVQGFADYKAVSVNEPPPLPFAVTPTPDGKGATLTRELSPGVNLEVTAGEGQLTEVVLLGKRVQDLQFPKDFLPLLGKLKF
jgi:hypothetical protein